MDEVIVTHSDAPEVVTYTVSCVVKGDPVVTEVIATHVEAGTHWVKFFNVGKLTAIFSAGTLVSALPK